MPEEKIIRNLAKCLACLEVIESKHRHDFVWCKCHGLAVDGGRDYLKRCFDPAKDWEEMSETEEVK